MATRLPHLFPIWISRIFKYFTTDRQRLGLKRIEAVLNKKFHELFKVIVRLPFVTDYFDAKEFLEKSYFYQLTDKINKHSTYIVSMIYTINRSIQKILYNYKKWSVDIDTIDHECTCNALGKAFNKQRSGKIGHICAPATSSSIIRGILGFQNFRSIPAPGLKHTISHIKKDDPNDPRNLRD